MRKSSGNGERNNDPRHSSQRSCGRAVAVDRRPKAVIAWANVTGKRTLGYFAIIRLGAVLGVCSAGEITNVTQAFQPSGRFWLANSQ